LVEFFPPFIFADNWVKKLSIAVAMVHLVAIRNERNKHGLLFVDS